MNVYLILDGAFGFRRSKRRVYFSDVVIRTYFDVNDPLVFHGRLENRIDKPTKISSRIKSDEKRKLGTPTVAHVLRGSRLRRQKRKIARYLRRFDSYSNTLKVFCKSRGVLNAIHALNELQLKYSRIEILCVDGNYEHRGFFPKNRNKETHIIDAVNCKRIYNYLQEGEMGGFHIEASAKVFDCENHEITIQGEDHFSIVTSFEVINGIKAMVS